MENLGCTILYIPKFYKVISSRVGKFYTFKNLTSSSAQSVENFIHSKILLSHYLKGWKILYILRLYKVIISMHRKQRFSKPPPPPYTNHPNNPNHFLQTTQTTPTPLYNSPQQPQPLSPNHTNYVTTFYKLPHQPTSTTTSTIPTTQTVFPKQPNYSK